jgi:putative hydrolase of HD superfamily
MQDLNNFFTNIQKLKRKKRRGWLVHRIEDSESTASHIFRMAILSWILGREKGLNSEKVIKMALVHDLCEVFTFDETPYDPFLPKKIDSSKSQVEAKKILEKWPPFTLEQKEEKSKKKREREFRALNKLVANLKGDLKDEMIEIWLDFENGLSQEARFLKQTDKAENFLQGMEYWERYGTIKANLWIRWAKGLFDDPLLVEFEKAVERRFFGNPSERKSPMDKILDFLIEVGKLKSKKRKKWIFRKVTKPEKIADHVFLTSIMVWVFSQNKDLSQKKLLKMTLCHEFGKIYLEDSTPHFILFPNLREEIRVLIQDPSRFFPKMREDVLKSFQKEYKPWFLNFPKRNKEKVFDKEYKKEKKSFKKVISLLPETLADEILNLWEQYYKGLSREGRFVQQIDILENFFQAINYYKENKDFPIEAWWSEIGEKIEEESLLSFIKLLHKISK